MVLSVRERFDCTVLTVSDDVVKRLAYMHTEVVMKQPERVLSSCDPEP